MGRQLLIRKSEAELRRHWRSYANVGALTVSSDMAVPPGVARAAVLPLMEAGHDLLT